MTSILLDGLETALFKSIFHCKRQNSCCVITYLQLLSWMSWNAVERSQETPFSISMRRPLKHCRHLASTPHEILFELSQLRRCLGYTPGQGVVSENSYGDVDFDSLSSLTLSNHVTLCAPKPELCCLGDLIDD